MLVRFNGRSELVQAVNFPGSNDVAGQGRENSRSDLEAIVRIEEANLARRNSKRGERFTFGISKTKAGAAFSSPNDVCVRKGWGGKRTTSAQRISRTLISVCSLA